MQISSAYENIIDHRPSLCCSGIQYYHFVYRPYPVSSLCYVPGIFTLRTLSLFIVPVILLCHCSSSLLFYIAIVHRPCHRRCPIVHRPRSEVHRIIVYRPQVYVVTLFIVPVCHYCLSSLSLNRYRYGGLIDTRYQIRQRHLPSSIPVFIFSFIDIGYARDLIYDDLKRTYDACHLHTRFGWFIIFFVVDIIAVFRFKT
jgi:hypothetical protein